MTEEKLSFIYQSKNTHNAHAVNIRTCYDSWMIYMLSTDIEKKNKKKPI